MFCYQCGSQIYNGVSKCPFCQAPMGPANEIIYDSMVSQIAPLCPRFVPGEETRFKLGDRTLSVSPRMSFILALNHFTDIIFENSWNELAGWIRHMSFGGIVQKGKDKLGSLADGVALATAAFMNVSGCNVDSRTVEDSFGFLWDVSHIMEPVYEIARNFSDTREAVNQALKSGGCAPRTSRWIGGGFGLGGAITGSITAGAMNMVGNAMHSTKNAAKAQILKWYTNSTLSKGQDAIKESDEFLLGFRSAWRDHIVRLHRALKSVMSEKCGFSDVLSPYDWGDELPFTFSALNERDSLEALSRNVYDVNAYVNLYISRRELGRELYAVAEACGISVAVGDAMAAYADAPVLRKLALDAIGYDTSREDLEAKARAIDELERNDPVYGFASANAYVRREQAQARKVRLFRDLAAISSLIEKLRSAGTAEKLTELAWEVLQKDDPLEREVLRRFLEGDGREDLKEILRGLTDRGAAGAAFARQVSDDRALDGCESHTVARILARRMANSGNPKGMFRLGFELMRGVNQEKPEKKDKEMGVRYMMMAARWKHPAAMRCVGEWYMLGQNGFPRDKNLAERYLLLASEMGDNAAKERLAKLQGGRK